MHRSHNADFVWKMQYKVSQNWTELNWRNDKHGHRHHYVQYVVRILHVVQFQTRKSSRYVQYVLLKGLKRAIWPHHKRLGNTYKNIETVRQRPRHLYKKKKNRAAPRRKSNKVPRYLPGFILNFIVLGTVAFSKFVPLRRVCHLSSFRREAAFIQDRGHLHDTLSSGKIGWYCLSSALNDLSTNLELFTQKSRRFAARLSLFQFSPQSGDFLPSFWTWSLTFSDYHRLEIWFRMRSEQTLSTNRSTGSALVAMGSSILDFCRYYFVFAKVKAKA